MNTGRQPYYVEPEDEETFVKVTFNLAELKQLHGTLVHYNELTVAELGRVGYNILLLEEKLEASLIAQTTPA